MIAFSSAAPLHRMVPCRRADKRSVETLRCNARQDANWRRIGVSDTLSRTCMAGCQSLLSTVGRSEESRKDHRAKRPLRRKHSSLNDAKGNPRVPPRNFDDVVVVVDQLHLLEAS